MTIGVKICGVTRREEIDVCAALGVEAIGLNLWPQSRRALTRAQAATLVAGWPAVARSAGGTVPLRVGVVVDPDPRTLVDDARALALDYVQLHGDAAPYADLGIPWIWVLRGTPALAGLTPPGRRAPAWVLLDAAVAGMGGEGTKTDWQWAARAVRALAPLPVWLAGGLDPDNVADAIREVGPAGVDVASGVEVVATKAGEDRLLRKDPARVAAFVQAVRAVK